MKTTTSESLMTAKNTYEAPALNVEGTLDELTLTPKNTTNKPDGFQFQGTVLTT